MNINTITGKEITFGYSTGGISNIYLLDIDHFISYCFKNDMLHDQCFVESIRISDFSYIELEAMDSCKFQESYENEIYKQQLTTIIRSLDSEKTSYLFRNQKKNHLIVFKTFENKFFCFGSDGGASLTFSQISGEVGGASGYNISINKNSVYPLFQIDFDYNYIGSLLSTENNDLISTENKYLISIFQLWQH